MTQDIIWPILKDICDICKINKPTYSIIHLDSHPYIPDLDICDDCLKELKERPKYDI